MNEWAIHPVECDDALRIEKARRLFRDYHGWLGEVVCSERLAAEIADLPGPYAPPAGRLLLAEDAAAVALGVVGIRSHEVEGACEMKRLYVTPEARGAGIGRGLAEDAIRAADDIGYVSVLLTTLPDSMDGALALYRDLGFVETDPFYDHSHVHDGVTMMFMRLQLR